MFRIMFCQTEVEGGSEPKARGIKTEHAAVVWSAVIGNENVEQFVARLNKCGVQEDELFDVVGEFLVG